MTKSTSNFSAWLLLQLVLLIASATATPSAKLTSSSDDITTDMIRAEHAGTVGEAHVVVSDLRLVTALV